MFYPPRSILLLSQCAPRATWYPALNFILPFRQGEMTIRELQNQLLELKRTSTSNSVGTALFALQQELAKPTSVFDPYKALAGLEALVDLARDNSDARAKRFSTILRQCRPSWASRSSKTFC